MNMNNFGEDLECIKSNEVMLNFFNVPIHSAQDERRLTRRMRDARKQSVLYY